jgi:hypothetical protein
VTQTTTTTKEEIENFFKGNLKRGAVLHSTETCLIGRGAVKCGNDDTQRINFVQEYVVTRVLANTIYITPRGAGALPTYGTFFKIDQAVKEARLTEGGWEMWKPAAWNANSDTEPCFEMGYALGAAPQMA